MRLIIDLDDTISFCHDRDWNNAKPNMPVIEKINSLYSTGVWEIVIHSSRGELSKINYTKQVTDWLKRYEVKYHSLQFGKPLADFYVDDKALRPDEFANLNFEPIKSLSGSEVYLINNLIHKVDPNAQDTLTWFKTAELLGYHVPEVKAVTGNKIVMEYIPRTKETFTQDCINIANAFSRTKKPVKYFSWKHYVDRVMTHWDTMAYDYQATKNLRTILMDQDIPETFSHGDLNPDNVIKNGTRLVLIDPLCVTYSSYKLDIAKVLAWELRKAVESNATWVYKLKKDDILSGVDILVIAETIRTLKYIKDSDLQTNLKMICLNFLKN